jgi:hypothetical protein
MAQSDKNIQNKETSNADVALMFMNSYKNFLDSLQTRASIDKWVINNSLLTDKFKVSYKNILDDAYKVEPKVGLDFDPIFDAQDYPDKGFKVIKYDSASGYITLGGVDWKEFTVSVKTIFQNNKCLIDGAGIINIPKDKQRKP